MRYVLFLSLLLLAACNGPYAGMPGDGTEFRVITERNVMFGSPVSKRIALNEPIPTGWK